MHVIGTAGHVDHGKSSLVKALTGMDPDRFEEEKRRGLTIDLGFAWFTLPSGSEVGIVDVPGHDRFIRNMLAGVGGIDAALFVVAADEGWMPQSTEHLQILDFLRVAGGLVVLTKTDLVDADTLEVVASEVADHVRGSVLTNAPIVEVSAVTGAGLDELQQALTRLLAEVEPSPDRGRPRLFADRSFTITGAGTVVTGTLTGGTLRVGEEVEILPAGHRSRIRSLQTHRRAVEEAEPGSRVALNLVGLEKQEVVRGDALVRPGQWETTREFAARLWTSRHLRHPVGENGAYELYVGAAEAPCRLKFLEEPPPAEGRLPVLAPGAQLLVQVFSMRSVPLDPGDRFIIRDVGRWETVAGGVVLDPAPGRIRRGDHDALERLRAREDVSKDELVARVIAERRLLPREAIPALVGIGADEAHDALQALAAQGRAVATASYAVETGHADGLERRVREVLAAHHEAHPMEPGMPRAAIAPALDIEKKALGELLDLWVGGGTVVTSGAVVRLPEHEISLPAADRQAADRALHELRTADASPPTVKELGLSFELLKALERRGEVVVVTPQIAFAAEVIERIEQAVVRLIGMQGPVTVSQVRDAIGTSRKYAVPLLEHLDSSGVTRRQDDKRVLGPRGRELSKGAKD